MNMPMAGAVECDVKTVAKPATPLLSVASLSKRYDGQDVIFRDISFELPKGQVVSIIGPNGAGKSTLLRCCVRLVEPDTGSVKIGQCELTALSHRQLVKARTRVGFVFQKHQLVGRMSVLSNVLHGALGRHRGPRLWAQALAPRDQREAAYHCLAQVGLQDFALRRADQLSGGQSQRVAVARALMQKSEMIFADEPTASLDPRSGNEIMELLQRLSHEQSLGVLMVSHDMSHAQSFSDRIVGLRDKGVKLNAPSHACSLSELRNFF
ncbi:phosphonate ABC transporter ATP-binding protein [Marinobacterium litorale]|uniref:phosphonate ABC transporter ATP-binding protein n=1 Tax=Marinobacterium litorale TaxID=404770 RepID=UPI001B7FE71F|nr:ATP-binding cassette domain-containing protein [Marinobacterium litorale]